MNARRMTIAPALLAAAALLLGGCAREERPAPLGVFAGIPPQKYFIERIAGGRVEVSVLVGPGQSPHTFEPTPRQMAELASARLYFSTGMPFERRLLDKVGSGGRLEVVDMRSGIRLRAIEGHGAAVETPAARPAEGGEGRGGGRVDHFHDHGPQIDYHGVEDVSSPVVLPHETTDGVASPSGGGLDDHTHGSTPVSHGASDGNRPVGDGGGEHEHAHEEGEPDPHIWLDPRLVKVQAATIAAALSRIDPENAGEYRANLAAFEAELEALDARLREALAPARGGEFFVFHPTFGYFADAYGLRQIPVEVRGREPGPRELAALIDAARGRGVKVIFVQPQFSRRSAEAVAEAIGGAVVPMDALAYDYMANLERIAAQLAGALAPGSESARDAAGKDGERDG